MDGDVLHGRRAERARIDGLLDGTRGGAGGVLVLRGDAGVGRSALLEYAARRAAGLRVLRGAGAEAEAGLPFAALHLLLRPHLALAGTLPGPQAAALHTAFGLAPARPGQEHLAGPALLALLGELARETPVLCLVDDAQWLDPASADALRFAARRLGTERVAMLLAVRTTPGRPDVWDRAGLPDLPLTPLDHRAAGLLLAERAPGLPAERRDRLITWAEGNPRALVELLSAHPDRWADALLDDGVHCDHLHALPQDTRTLLTVAAADDTGAPAVIVEAARRLGVTLDALDAAERAGLVRLTQTRFGFRHPLIRAAAYRHAPVATRLAA
ncbi:MAG TPA: AAA family ATPase, partial [Thermomonospora sp.]|nr:AAA family ATPase [Thermomonospora sp.]